MNLQLLILFFAILSVILGFIALLSQKIYLDPRTQKATEIEVPILGKMKSNYPSLIFVFLGFALVFFLLYQHAQKEPVSWKVSGSFSSDNTDIKWSGSKLSIFPVGVDPTFDKNTGKFDIILEIEKGRTFEERFEGITYTDDTESATIVPSQELEKYNNGELGLLKIKTPRMRVYKSKKLEKMSE